MLLCLNEEELSLWNQIAERDLSHQITLNSGIRTPKQIITDEIKRWRNQNQKLSIDQPPPSPSSPQEPIIPTDPPSEPNTGLESLDPADLPYVPTPVGVESQDIPSHPALAKSEQKPGHGHRPPADLAPGESGPYSEEGQELIWQTSMHGIIYRFQSCCARTPQF